MSQEHLDYTTEHPFLGPLSRPWTPHCKELHASHSQGILWLVCTSFKHLELFFVTDQSHPWHVHV